MHWDWKRKMSALMQLVEPISVCKSTFKRERETTFVERLSFGWCGQDFWFALNLRNCKRQCKLCHHQLAVSLSRGASGWIWFSLICTYCNWTKLSRIELILLWIFAIIGNSIGKNEINRERKRLELLSESETQHEKVASQRDLWREREIFEFCI